MMFPKPQSGLGWPSIVVFNANNDGGVHLGKKIFRRAHTRPQNAPKIPLKPPKMAILRPNLNDGVLPRDNGEVLLWQYTWVSSSSSQSTLPIEDIEHVLTQCVGTSDTRRAKLPALLSLAATAKSNINIDIDKISSNNSILTQFLLDCIAAATLTTIPEYLPAIQQPTTSTGKQDLLTDFFLTETDPLFAICLYW